MILDRTRLLYTVTLPIGVMFLCCHCCIIFCIVLSFDSMFSSVMFSKLRV